MCRHFCLPCRGTPLFFFFLRGRRIWGGGQYFCKDLTAREWQCGVQAGSGSGDSVRANSQAAA
jgi:hypothetical protein